MTITEKLINEDFDIQPENRFFSGCDHLKKTYDIKIYGIFAQRIEGSDLKLRFAAYGYEVIKNHLKDVEHGEFIYLDDKTRLMLSYHFESMAIYLRAALDMAISAYTVYFKGKTDLDSFSDFIKEVKKEQSWIPGYSMQFWQDIVSNFEHPNTDWTNWLIGKDDGISVRDKSVHKGTIPIYTVINEKDKGRVVVDYNRKESGYLSTITKTLFENTLEILERIRFDIIEAEKNLD